MCIGELMSQETWLIISDLRRNSGFASLCTRLEI